MQKHLFTPLVLGILLFACQKADNKAAEELEDNSVPQIAQRKCASSELLEQQMAADPSFRKRRMDIEQAAETFAKNGQGRLVNGVLEIPVVVHVVYNTTTQNISDAQIQSQIRVLNEDFNNTNPDNILVPTEFRDEQTNMNIRFTLDSVIRVKTKVNSWSTNDAVKNSKRGGSNAVNPSYYLNMWVCNLGQGLLGYAQFPGGNPSTDGVVMLYSAFGSSKYAPGVYSRPYDLGRTTTHEVGHWMNLRHIWGDASCGNDFVNDTPTAHGANYGCPGTIAGCVSGEREMTMNYMDYTDDACMYMFTNGQKTRVDAAFFATNAPRATFAR